MNMGWVFIECEQSSHDNAGLVNLSDVKIGDRCYLEPNDNCEDKRRFPVGWYTLIYKGAVSNDRCLLDYEHGRKYYCQINEFDMTKVDDA
jgi:hypothetical protein